VIYEEYIHMLQLAVQFYSTKQRFIT